MRVPLARWSMRRLTSRGKDGARRAGFCFGKLQGALRLFRRHKIGLKNAHAVTRRKAWFDSLLDLVPDRLVFIDETRTLTNMARRTEWAPKGQRLRVGVSHGHRKTKTFRLSSIVAPMVRRLARAPPRARSAASSRTPSAMTRA